MTIIEAEAAVIRETRTRVLAGESLRSICRDLNDRAIPTSQGGPWQVTTLKGVLTSARISGRREYHGEIVHEDSWPAIITPEASDQLRALLDRPGQPRPAARSYLYSGILRCWKCEKGLGGRRYNGRRRYICAKAPGNGRCGTVAVFADLAETEVRDKVLTALDEPGFVTRLLTAGTSPGHAEEITGRLREIEAQRDELAEMWRLKELTRKE